MTHGSDKNNPARSGFILVVALAMIALITVVVVAYFSRAATNRRIESATSGAAKADTLARGAAQIIVSDIEAEIIGGSEVTQPTGQMPIYRPTAAQNAVPSRVLADSSMLTDATFNNLVKQSVGRFFPTGYSGTPLITTTTGRDTSIASTNNRVVSTSRWNAPVLNTGSGFSGANQLPQWILIDRQGIASNQNWNTSIRDYTPGNNNAVIGRFAFNVYDEGGLLDSNVAGYPIFSTALTSSQIQQLKSTLAGAYLYDGTAAVIPGFTTQTKQQTFVNTWKFPTAGVASSGNFFLDFMRYPNTSVGTLPTSFADTGFMRPILRSSTTTTIAYSRQDLIRATLTSNAYLTTAALPYFTHFSRELNAPSWFPQQNASNLGGNNGTENIYAYFTNRDSASAANRFVPNVRVTTAFTRGDGTQAVVGEPLIKNRFPLRRLSAVGSTGLNTGGFPVMLNGALQAPDTTTVQRDFGLVWDNANSRWSYVGASTNNVLQSRILTLDEVAQGKVLDASGNYDTTQVPVPYREPNFFELLKAFILSGSIGLGSGSSNTFAASEQKFYLTTNSLSADSQIIQIGANVIDQWDSDKNPTFIYFAGNEVAGLEDLPYLSKLVFQPVWTTGSSAQFRAWLEPSFWIPSQNGTTSGTATVRFIMTSGTVSAAVYAGATSKTADGPVTATASDTTTQPWTQLTTTRAFGPNPNSSAYGNGTSPSRQLMTGFTTGSGNPSSSAPLGIQPVFNSTPGITSATTTKAVPLITNATFEMQIQIGSTWKTYQRWNSCNSSTAACIGSGASFWQQTTINDPEFVMLDPRTMRFGAWESDAGTTGSADLTRGILDTLDRASVGFQGTSSMGPQGSYFGGSPTQLAQMANNSVSSAAYYTDLDGVRRTGDALNSSDTSAMVPTNTADRSPILNRETRTVAELGTVFRDQPWKTLNFTTTDSADAGLPDAFTIFEPNSVFRSNVTAGKISLNTKQPAVLRAVLAGIATNTNNSTPLITDTQRNAIADALIRLTSDPTTGQPMINKSELVTRLASDNAVTSLGSKEAREAVIRALSDVGQTRTWNLMIDVIAQAGRYNATASNVDNFIVQGEKRYWLHVAIDRFTGEVIDQQLEEVFE